MRAAAAAIDGGASMFGSGVNPGYVQYLAAVATNVCRTASYVSILESFDIGPWAGDANQDELGWGRPAGDTGHDGRTSSRPPSRSATPARRWPTCSA